MQSPLPSKLHKMRKVTKRAKVLIILSHILSNFREIQCNFSLHFYITSMMNDSQRIERRCLDTHKCSRYKNGLTSSLVADVVAYTLTSKGSFYQPWSKKPQRSFALYHSNAKAAAALQCSVVESNYLNSRLHKKGYYVRKYFDKINSFSNGCVKYNKNTSQLLNGFMI